jgi:hypothetical protein
VGGGDPGERVEQVRVRADQDAGLPAVDPGVDDRRGLLRRCHRHGLELRGQLLVGASAPFGVPAHPGVAGDVRGDAARVHGHRADAGAAQFLPQRLGEAADGELRRAVGALVRHPEQAVHAGGVDDRAFAPLDEDRQERPRPVHHAAEVDVVQPVVVLGHRVEHGRGHRDAGVVEHRGQGSREPLADLAGEPQLVFRVADVEDAGQHPAGQRGRGGLEAVFVDVGEGDRRAEPRQPGGQRPADAGRRPGDHHGTTDKAVPFTGP